ncbi:CD151 antigen [Solenopsis invicta]|uniref:CD151 antigen n=1 Tax=Solenopsis invicta TaxID=13686 RepID=UPI00193CE4E8|nr:CD151 antigen [Solenopsis invicta]
MNGCERFIKYLLFAINLVILIVGTSITIITIVIVWGVVGKSSWIGEMGNDQLAVAFIVLLMIGIIMISIAIFGIVAALRKIKSMLLIYVIFVFLLLVIVIGGVQQYNSYKKVIKFFKIIMENSLQFYYDKKFIRSFWNITQSMYHCCGIDSWEDWKAHGLTVPDSCCKLDQQSNCNAEWHIKILSKVYASGCINELQSSLQQFTNVMNGITSIFTCIMVLGMVFSFTLYTRIKKQDTKI